MTDLSIREIIDEEKFLDWFKSNFPKEEPTQGLLGNVPREQSPSQIEMPSIQPTTPPQPVEVKTEEKSNLNEEIGRKTLEATQGKIPAESILTSNNALETNSPIKIDKSGAPPNPVYSELMNQLAYAKALYETANRSEKGDKQRQYASRIAQTIRGQAEALGIDISQFGATNANAADVYKNISTQRLQDIMNLTQGNAFNKSSDDFFQDRYKLYSRNKGNNIFSKIGSALGINMDDPAKERAQEEARQYQAKRMAYLEGMLYGYGFDGNKGLNRLGHQIAGMIAQENPEYVSAIMQRYPNADVRSSELEDKDIELASKLLEKKIGQGYTMQGKAFDRDSALIQLILGGNINAALKLLSNEQNKEFATHTGKIARQNMEYQNALDIEKDIIKGKKGGGTGTDSKAADSARQWYEIYKNRQDEIMEQLQNPNLTPEEKKRLEDELHNAETYAKGFENVAMSALNVPNMVYPDYTGNPVQDDLVIRSIINNAGDKATVEDVVSDIIKWIHEVRPDLNEAFIREALKNNYGLDTLSKPPTPQQVASTTQKERKPVPKDSFGDHRQEMYKPSKKIEDPRPWAQ